MLEKKEIVRRVWNKLDEKQIIQLLVDLVNTPSPTGDEHAAAEVVRGYMSKRGVSSELQEVEEGRANAIGRVKGSGEGLSLMFNGHLDTSLTGIHNEDYPMVNSQTRALKASVHNGCIFGLGTRNMKAGVAAFTAAVSAVAEADIGLTGEVIGAGVVGEIERSPVQGLYMQYSGRRYRGCGIGMKYAFDHGVVTDVSVTCEPSGNLVSRARCGFIYLKLTTLGRTSYSPYQAVTKSDNAIVKMARIVDPLQTEFAPSYTRKHTYDLGADDGKMEPQVTVGAIESGWPYKPNFVPAICCSYMDLFIAPNQRIIDAIDEVKDFIKKKGLKEEKDFKLEAFLTRGPGTQTPADHFIVRRCKAAYEFTTGKKHPAPASANQSWGDDSNTTRAHGIPSVTWGPGTHKELPSTVSPEERAEYVTIDDLILMTKMYIAAAIDICSTPKRQAI